MPTYASIWNATSPPSLLPTSSGPIRVFVGKDENEIEREELMDDDNPYRESDEIGSEELAQYVSNRYNKNYGNQFGRTSSNSGRGVEMRGGLLESEERDMKEMDVMVHDIRRAREQIGDLDIEMQDVNDTVPSNDHEKERGPERNIADVGLRGGPNEIVEGGGTTIVPEGCVIVIIDTNILIGHLPLLASLMDLITSLQLSPFSSSSSSNNVPPPSPLFIIPSIVLSEIDGLKKSQKLNSNSNTSNLTSPKGRKINSKVGPPLNESEDLLTVGEKAHRANLWILKALRDKGFEGRGGMVRGQRRWESMFRKEGVGQREVMRVSPDTLILDCCRYFQYEHRPQGGLGLLTEDKNLCARAEGEGILTANGLSIFNPKSFLSNLYPPYRYDHHKFENDYDKGWRNVDDLLNARTTIPGVVGSDRIRLQSPSQSRTRSNGEIREETKNTRSGTQGVRNSSLTKNKTTFSKENDNNPNCHPSLSTSASASASTSTIIRKSIVLEDEDVTFDDDVTRKIKQQQPSGMTMTTTMMMTDENSMQMVSTTTTPQNHSSLTTMAPLDSGIGMGLDQDEIMMMGTSPSSDMPQLESSSTTSTTVPIAVSLSPKHVVEDFDNETINESPALVLHHSICSRATEILSSSVYAFLIDHLALGDHSIWVERILRDWNQSLSRRKRERTMKISIGKRKEKELEEIERLKDWKKWRLGDCLGMILRYWREMEELWRERIVTSPRGVAGSSSSLVSSGSNSSRKNYGYGSDYGRGLDSGQVNYRLKKVREGLESLERDFLGPAKKTKRKLKKDPSGSRSIGRDVDYEMQDQADDDDGVPPITWEEKNEDNENPDIPAPETWTKMRWLTTLANLDMVLCGSGLVDEWPQQRRDLLSNRDGDSAEVVMPEPYGVEAAKEYVELWKVQVGGMF